MNTGSITASDRIPPWRSRVVRLAALPLAIMLAAVVTASYVALRESRRFESELARFRAEGWPIDNESLAIQFEQKTSRAGTAALTRAIHLASVSWKRHFAEDFEIDTPYPNSPDAIANSDADRIKEARIEESLDRIRPVIDDIHAAVQFPAPVWHPMIFLGDVQFAMRLLDMDLDRALAKREAKRALRDLDSMRRLAASVDWKLLPETDAVHTALQRMHRIAVRRSLAAGLWSGEQTVTLRGQVGSGDDIETRWREVVSGELAGLLESEVHSLTDSRDPLVAFFGILRRPIIGLQLITDFRKVVEIASQSPEQLVRNARLVDTSRAANRIYVGRRVLTLEVLATSYLRDEDIRRFTITCIAVKQFQLQEGRWPVDLEELQMVGLSKRDWTTISAGKFGYRARGDTAHVWCYDRFGSRVSEDLPVIDATEDMVVVGQNWEPGFVATIR